MASCQAVVQSFGTPRFDAGEPHSDDILKCQLRPLPSGVCDYSKPGMGQGPTTTWLTYQEQRGNVTHGGRPLGPAPTSMPFGPRVRAAAKPDRKRRHRHAVRPAFTG